MRIITFPEQLYVGVQQAKPFDTIEFPLAFATPYGTDAAFEKRKYTVDDWAKGRYYNRVEIDDYQGNIIDNVPMSGFSFDRVVGRWHTAREWFRVQDPRGFTLEINADNLGEIICGTTIDKGWIEGNYIWGREGNQNRLISEQSEFYIESLKPKEVFDPKPGDLVFDGKNETYYIGKYYVHALFYDTQYRTHQNGEWTFNNDRFSYDHYYTRQAIVLGYCAEPVHVCLRVYGKEHSGYVDFRKTWGKHSKVIRKNAFDVSTFSDYEKSEWRRYYYHENKEDFKKFSMSVNEMDIEFKKFYNIDDAIKRMGHSGPFVVVSDKIKLTVNVL